MLPPSNGAARGGGDSAPATADMPTIHTFVRCERTVVRTDRDEITDRDDENAETATRRAVTLNVAIGVSDPE